MLVNNKNLTDSRLNIRSSDYFYEQPYGVLVKTCPSVDPRVTQLDNGLTDFC